MPGLELSTYFCNLRTETVLQRENSRGCLVKKVFCCTELVNAKLNFTVQYGYDLNLQFSGVPWVFTPTQAKSKATVNTLNRDLCIFWRICLSNWKPAWKIIKYISFHYNPGDFPLREGQNLFFFLIWGKRCNQMFQTIFRLRPFII